MLRYLTAGESHGKALTAIIEGLPAGVEINRERVNEKLKRRQGGYGRGKRMAIESDKVEVLSGLRGGITLGTPLTLLIHNKDWENWESIMDHHNKKLPQERIVHNPRPGHADLAGSLKYRQEDIRNVLERASARATAIQVAVGAVAQEFLSNFKIKLQGQVVSVGKVESKALPQIVEDKLYDTALYCPDPQATEAMVAAIDQAKEQGDTLGGVFQVIAEGLPQGLGSHVHWDRRLDGKLAQALMSIPGIKGVEIGIGFGGSALPGSQVHDEIFYSAQQGFYHGTNKAGGLEGGITNGENLVVKGAMKPIPTLMKPLKSINRLTKEPVSAAVERSDVCAVPAATIVGEAAVAWVLATEILLKFGGDHLEETLTNYHNYLEYITKR